MSINIRYQLKSSDPKNFKFGDDVSEITLGRDPALCQVAFPADETLVGRQHCVVIELAGRYRLETNGSNLVLFEGEPVIGSLDLDPDHETPLQLGKNGPIVHLLPSQSGDLPPTVGRVSQPGLATLTRETHRRSIKSSRLAWIGNALIGFMAFIGLAVTGGLKNDQTTAESRIAEVEQGVKSATESLVELKELSDEQRKEVLAFTDTLNRFGQRTETSEPKLADALAKVRESVYVVAFADEKGRISSTGTAWVVDRKRGYLATNSHVAKSFNTLRATASMLVLSPGPKTTKLTVNKIIMHPGYDAFTALWSEYSPVRQFANNIENIDNIPAYDVALLQVDEPERLAADIPLASPKEISKITAGMSIGYVGYPMENVAIGGVNLDSPSPTTQVGIVTAVTDYFNAATESDQDRLLVQHSAPGSGGSSGSPILNSNGHVICVHSAGNFIRSAGNERAASPANIFYAQGIQLVGELLDGTAIEKQAEREADWRKMVAAHFKPRKQAEAGVAREDLDELYEQAFYSDTVSGEFTVKKTISKRWNGIPTQELQMKDGSTMYSVAVNMPLDQVGIHLLAAATTGDAKLFLNAHDKTTPADTLVTKNAFRGNVEYVFLNMPSPGEIMVEPRISVPNQEVILESVFWEIHRRSSDELHGLLVKKWQGSLGDSQDKKKGPVVIASKKVETKQVDAAYEKVTHEGKKFFASKFNFNVNTTGPHLLALVSLDPSNLGLVVFKNNQGQTEEATPGSWSSLAIEIGADNNSVTGVVASEKKAPYELRIYR